ncbi:MAG: hypothetical protein CFH15_01479 [Alphaproteobacteria bacterium MarineAlpha5_Bin5]|nr:MAG: hypothetical protein CFH15_01479 [Alphaproteobacteria bacterium MarineAlpha5_Bin5]
MKKLNSGNVSIIIVILMIGYAFLGFFLHH